MKSRKWLLNLTLLGASTMIAMLLGEFVARQALNASDYLSVDMVPHDVLGAAPAPHTAGGFDSWGFRNRSVPKAASIVAIGDSHTYGNTATMEDSWPYVLGGLTGRDVYNMGLGGYGPNQYLELLKSKALSLKPQIIICGLYIGDDFENAFLITYGLDYWASLRELPAENVNFDIWEAPVDPSWHKRIRIWLSGHSVIYQLVVHGPLLGRLQGELQIRNARSSDSATSLKRPEQNIEEAFLPKGILRRLDQESASVREGMRITFELLKEMNEICRKNGVQFLVVVIPTKEMVFADYLERDSTLPLADVLGRLVANERLALDRTFAFLTESNISYVDTLPALRLARTHELYARSAVDMHPSKNGYRVIAESVLAAWKPK